MEAANRDLEAVYRPAFNCTFARPRREQGSALVALMNVDLDAIVREHCPRTVSWDNGVTFWRLKLQIPANRHRMHFVKAKVRVHRRPGGMLAVLQGSRKLADYTRDGIAIDEPLEIEAVA